MFFASETAKSTRNELQAVLGVRFDYDLVAGCVSTCSDKDPHLIELSALIWDRNIIEHFLKALTIPLKCAII